MSTNDDLPEAKPAIVPIWHFGNVISFSRCGRGGAAYHVIIPFPLAPVIDRERGIVLKGLFTNGPSYGPGDVIALAQRGENGFRFVEGEE